VRKPLILALWSCALSCGPGGPPTPPPKTPCGDEASIVRVHCAPASLVAVQREGVWNFRMKYSHDTEWLTSVLDLRPGLERVWNQPLQSPVTESLYFVINENYENVHYRLGFAGCSATSPEAFTGRFNLCRNGELVSGGEFEARRLVRNAQEQESENVNLVAELPVRQGRALDVFVADNLAFVVHDRGGLTLIDVTDRHSPMEVAFVSSGYDLWNGVVVKDNVAFIASAREGVIAYDVSVPAVPTRLWTWPFPVINVHTVQLVGNRVYAMSPSPVGETLILDVTDAKVAKELGRFRSASASSVSYPHDASIFEDRLYVNHWGGGVVVADVANAASPTELGKVVGTSTTSHASQVGRVDGVTYLFEGGEEWGAALSVFNVTQVSSAAKVGGFALRPFVSIHNMLLVGTRLYVAWYQEGVRVLEVSNPAAPSQVGYFNTWRESDPGRGESFYDGAVGIRVPGDGYIYVAEAGRGLMIFQEVVE